MRNREATLRKLDSVESNLNRMTMTLNQGNREACYEVIQSIREQIEQLKLYIESEPITGSELNRMS
jgi:hypothetical protein